MRDDLPQGTVTFLFTDIEGSTRLLRSLGPEAYAETLAEHRHVIREACAAEGGVEVDTQGNAFFFAFARARDAVVAAAGAQLARSPMVRPAFGSVFTPASHSPRTTGTSASMSTERRGS